MIDIEGFINGSYTIKREIKETDFYFFATAIYDEIINFLALQTGNLFSVQNENL